jgi:PIN domain nuclease of toxin-antitoxin system
MILMDTHIWFWWVQDVPRLSQEHREALGNADPDELYVSVFSCWEIVKLVERNRLNVGLPLEEWFDLALVRSSVRTLPLSLDVVLDVSKLPAGINRDPADQIIVSTARVHGCPLATADHNLRAYPHVRII